MISKTFIKRLNELNLSYKEYNKGIMIDLEHVINNEATPITRDDNNTLMKLIKRYKLDYEYRGYYTALLVKELIQ